MGELTSLTLDQALSEASQWMAASNHERAMARYNQLAAHYPDAVRILQARAQAAESAGEMHRAVEDYRRILDILPCDSRAMIGLARCQLKAGHASEASVFARQALAHAANDADALKIAGEAEEGLIGRGRITEASARFRAGLTSRAIAEMRRMDRAEPERTDVQVVLAEMLWRDGYQIAAIELCQSILDEQPDCLNAHALLAALWSRTGNSDIAASHRGMLERFDPEYRVVRDWLAEASPYEARDVPAVPAAYTAPQPVAQPVARENTEGARDRSAWVDELIAAASPVPPQAPPDGGAETAQNSGAEVADTPDESHADAILGLPPLEWTPLPAEEDAEVIPAWLTALQTTKPAAPAPEGAEDDGFDLSYEAQRKLASTGNSAAPPATATPWSPDAQKLPPDSVEIMARPAAGAGRKRTRRGRKNAASAADTLALARAAMQAGNYDEASDYYAALINANQSLDEALADLDAAVQAHPQERRFYGLLGEVYSRKGEVNAALMAYHRAIEDRLS